MLYRKEQDVKEIVVGQASAEIESTVWFSRIARVSQLRGRDMYTKINKICLENRRSREYVEYVRVNKSSTTTERL